MPGLRCSVSSCKNSRMMTKARGQNISYHIFPKDKDPESSNIRNEWIKRCKRGEKWNPNTSHICSIHFTELDFERDLQNELLGLPLKKKLRKHAIPTLHLPNETPPNKSKKSKEEEILIIIEEEPSSTETPPIEFVDVSEVKMPYEELLQKYQNLCKRHAALRRNSQGIIKRLNEELKSYKMSTRRRHNVEA